MDVPVEGRLHVEGPGSEAFGQAHACSLWSPGAHPLLKDGAQEDLRGLCEAAEDTGVAVRLRGRDPRLEERQAHKIRYAEELYA